MTRLLGGFLRCLDCEVALADDGGATRLHLLAGAAEGKRIRRNVFGDDAARSDQCSVPIETGATSDEFEPMKAPAPIWVSCLFTPS